MKKFIVIFFLWMCNFVLSQDFCSKIDSIVVHYMPWNLNTRLSLTTDAIRNTDEFIARKIFVDTSSINSFSRIYLNDNRIKDSINYSLDVRMVIDLYIGNTFIPVSIDRVQFYNYLGNSYRRNKKLIDWVNKYVVPTE